MSRQLTGPFLDFKVDLQRLARRMLAIDKSVRVVIVIGIVICILQAIQLMHM
ncbi:hypothetical protein RHGRI_029133 [Rhododendron griersonianum]|uniref:Uncharacterized protein n=1 Tax=Rhododendron griersonianum TaxID=479676 RepID=A0AAV6II68_9ERIC|nr:hypothetical protein RHGRI_029133 [Rhododendron griersonianum]